MTAGARAKLTEKKSPGKLTTFTTCIMIPGRHDGIMTVTEYGADKRGAAEERLKWLESLIEKHPESFM